MKQKELDFQRKQIYEVFGKSKGLSCDEFIEEADKILKNIQESRETSERFKKEYSARHKCCPECGSERCSTTFTEFIMIPGEEEKYRDENNCVCYECKNKHIVHDRISKFLAVGKVYLK